MKTTLGATRREVEMSLQRLDTMKLLEKEAKLKAASEASADQGVADGKVKTDVPVLDAAEIAANKKRQA